MFARVAEGHDDRGKWIFEHVWNGDQTDYGLKFIEARVLRVKVATN